MLLQIDKSQLDTLNDNDEVKLKCVNCGNIFFVKKRNLKKTNSHNFCSAHCFFESLLCKFIRLFRDIELCPMHFILHSHTNRKKIKRKRLSTFIIKELSKKFPDRLITQTDDNQTDLVFDIFIPSLNIAFIFRKIYIKNDQAIKENIFEKINYCRSKNIKLYVFDIDEIGKFNTKRARSVSSVIYDKILYEITYRKLFGNVGNEQV